tara:strand:- start:71 stop:370 length:300 start_codon:yes stop_codon:yes gene_type:complete
MTKDEIIALAVKAGLIRVGDGWTEPHRWGLAELEAFANLVASAARNMTFTQAHWTDYEESIVAAEREECAKVCESLAMQQDSDVRDECAAAIRARKTHD